MVGNESFDSLVDMANGAIRERIDYEAQRVYDNIKDPNTDPCKKRKIKITLCFAPDEDRESVKMTMEAKCDLAATMPITTRMYLVNDENGEQMMVESVKQVPGQTDLTGDVAEEPKILKLAKRA